MNFLVAQAADDTTTTAAPPAHFKAIVTGALAGGGPHVKVFDLAAPNEPVRSFFAYDANFSGGVNVALGDVDGDGYEDIITAPASGGGPHVKVFSGATGGLLASFFAYDPAFMGGVNIAACDLNGDGFADIITGASAGGGGDPHVKVFSGADGSTLASFYAYNVGFRGGVRVASADVDGDGKAEIVTAAGPTGGPHVKFFELDGTTPDDVAPNGFYAYGANFTGGVFVGASVGADHVARIVTGAGPGGGQHVRVFDPMGTELAAVIPAGSGTQGATVAIGQLDADGEDEYVVGNASQSPTVKSFDLPAVQKTSGNPYPGFNGGVSVAAGEI